VSGRLETQVPLGSARSERAAGRAGLITRGRAAQWRPCRIDVEALRPVDDWLARYRQLWEERFDRLDAYLHELQAKDHKREKPKTEKQPPRAKK
jgi:hypothetical protein